MSREREIIPITNDVMFKALFVRNPNLLKSFLSAALEIPESEITNITIRNPELTPLYYEGKMTRLDILLETNGRIINIEMQVAKKDYYRERSLHYCARMYHEELKEGEDYGKAGRCIGIHILNFTMFEDCPDYHSSFSMREDNRHELLLDKMQIHYLELPKVKKVSGNNKPDEENSLQLWMQLFKAKSKEELDMLNDTKVEAIQNGVKVIYGLSGDAQIREYVRQREKAVMDYNSDMASAEAKGRAKGREEGKAEAYAELIAGWKAKGMTDEEIQKLLPTN